MSSNTRDEDHNDSSPQNDGSGNSLAGPKKLSVIIGDQQQGTLQSPISTYGADDDSTLVSPVSIRSVSELGKYGGNALYDDMVSLPSPFVGQEENFDHFLSSFGGSGGAVSRQSSLRLPNKGNPHFALSSISSDRSPEGVTVDALSNTGAFASSVTPARSSRIISEYIPSPIKAINANLRHNREYNQDVLTGDKQSIPLIPKNGGELLEVRKARLKPVSSCDVGYVPTVKQPQRSASEQIRPDVQSDILKREHRTEEVSSKSGVTLPATEDAAVHDTKNSVDNVVESDEGLRTYEAFSTEGVKKSTWREISVIGRGAFSKVSLAIPSPHYVKRQYVEKVTNYRVAVKVITLGPAGGASRSQIQNGVKRELEILKSLRSPTLIRILAFNMDSEKALMVLPFYNGKDLFEFIGNSSAPKPCIIIRRLFAEIVDAVCYLHRNNIVHRDIKLENVLLRLTAQEILKLGENCHQHRQAIISLTDFGLSRRIDPDNPTLTTRCGSDDYVPPEILMGQPYDGRETDSWALGVLLYGMLEKRLPFDPPKNMPAHRVRGRVAHRIAKVEWSWIRFQPLREEQDASNVSPSDREWIGGLEIVEGCLKRRDSRWLATKEVVESPWLADVVERPLLESQGFEVNELFE